MTRSTGAWWTDISRSCPRVPSVRGALDAIRRMFAGSRRREDRERAAEELLAIARLLDRQPRLRSAFTDPALAPEAKRGLAEAVLGRVVSSQAMEALLHVVTEERMHARELPDVIEQVGAQALLDAAEEAGALNKAED